MFINNDIKFYFFTNTLDEIITKNIKNFKKLSFIYKSNSINDINHTNINTIKSFCRKNRIPFFISDNFKLAKKYGADGIFLSSSYKKIGNIILKKKNFKIIGSAHNQLEYFLKKKQLCEMILLSPLFYNKKYSQNMILNVCKFNLISMDWKKKICALGGINLNNLKKLNMTRSSAAAFISLMKQNGQKKSPLTISSKQAF
jgi:thiamine-phosphate pyrophosphorylase